MHRWTTHGKKRRSALPAEAGVATVKGRHGVYTAEAPPNPNARAKPPPVLEMRHREFLTRGAVVAFEGTPWGTRRRGFGPALTLNWRSSLVSKPATVNNFQVGRIAKPPM